MASETKAKRARKPKASTTDLAVALVLDKSGSMGHLRQSVIEGVNDYLAELREQDGETFLSVTQFDTGLYQMYVGKPLDEVRDLTYADYLPGGFTALFDAIARTILDLDERLKKEGREDMKVLVVVVTDGLENHSVEYAVANGGQRAIRALVEAYEEKGNWTFTYLGLGMDLADAFAQADAVGIPTGNVGVAASSQGGMAASYSTMAAATNTRRSSVGGQTASLYADTGADQNIPEAPPEPRKRSKPTTSSLSDALGRKP